MELIELGVRGPVTDDQRRDLERVRYNQRHLLSLIGNILDFTRLDAQKLPIDIGEVRVDRAAAAVLTSVAPLLDEKSLRRECRCCDSAVVVRADPARLDQSAQPGVERRAIHSAGWGHHRGRVGA